MLLGNGVAGEETVLRPPGEPYVIGSSRHGVELARGRIDEREKLAVVHDGVEPDSKDRHRVLLVALQAVHRQHPIIIAGVAVRVTEIPVRGREVQPPHDRVLHGQAGILERDLLNQLEIGLGSEELFGLVLVEGVMAPVGRRIARPRIGDVGGPQVPQGAIRRSVVDHMADKNSSVPLAVIRLEDQIEGALLQRKVIRGDGDHRREAERIVVVGRVVIIPVSSRPRRERDLSVPGPKGGPASVGEHLDIVIVVVVVGQQLERRLLRCCHVAETRQRGRVVRIERQDGFIDLLRLVGTIDGQHEIRETQQDRERRRPRRRLRPGDRPRRCRGPRLRGCFRATRWGRRWLSRRCRLRRLLVLLLLRGHGRLRRRWLCAAEPGEADKSSDRHSNERAVGHWDTERAILPQGQPS